MSKSEYIPYLPALMKIKLLVLQFNEFNIYLRIDKIFGEGKVCFIIGFFLWFSSRPHHTISVNKVHFRHNLRLCQPKHYSDDLMALRPKSCRVCMSFSTKEVRGSNVSSSGSHGGPFTTTFTPWKYLSLPSSSTMRCVDVFTCKQSDPGPWAIEKAPRPRINKRVATCRLDIFEVSKMWAGLVHVTQSSWFQLHV